MSREQKELIQKEFKIKIIKDLGLKDSNTFWKSVSGDIKIRRERKSIFECPECGNHFEATVTNVKTLRVKNCGCLRVEKFRKAMTTHNMSRTKLYQVWSSMRHRCYNSNNKKFKNYGGRGIIVCEEWKKDFASFQRWASESGYREGLSLDRRDNNGNYDL